MLFSSYDKDTGIRKVLKVLKVFKTTTGIKKLAFKILYVFVVVFFFLFGEREKSLVKNISNFKSLYTRIFNTCKKISGQIWSAFNNLEAFCIY